MECGPYHSCINLSPNWKIKYGRGTAYSFISPYALLLPIWEEDKLWKELRGVM
ncbi:hypothetical protein ABG79_01717 [Caloramator mitchellensis]|uniref:Uncharacterized protein n=1 Tax=Caloramator mitchellensis TaxID=908809 RepID=A0A0R3JZV3_CALMK|nr:hypothetical protein ABG79_01717 [Caloramator mitchellensis]